LANRLFLYLTKIILVAIFIGLTLSPSADADDFEIIPSVMVREEYNDNIFFTDDDRIDDFITTIAGSLEVIERTERLDAYFLGRFAPYWYEDNSTLNDLDWLVKGDGDYQFTERFKAGASAGYLVDNRTDRDVADTGIIIGNRERKRWDAGLEGNYSFSEITAARLDYAFRDEDWDQGDIDDLTAHDIILGFTRNFSGLWESTTARVNFGYSYFDYETSETDVYFGSVGVEHKFTEKFSAIIDIGPRYSDSDFDTLKEVEVAPGVFRTVVVDDSDSQWGGVGNLDLDYREERTFFRLTGSHGVYPASGRPGPTERTTARFIFTRLFAEKFRFSLPLGWIWNRADGDFSVDEIDTDTAYIRPFVRWEFYSGFTLEGSYGLTYVWDNDDDEERYRHKAFVQLAWGLPLFDLFRDFDPVSGGRPSLGFQELRYGR
jgi:hypothetical protein